MDQRSSLCLILRMTGFVGFRYWVTPIRDVQRKYMEFILMGMALGFAKNLLSIFSTYGSLLWGGSSAFDGE